MDVLTGIEVETETAVWQRLMAQLSQLCGLLRIDLADLARIRG
jgi:ABC-type transporter Mla MlaB component